MPTVLRSGPYRFFFYSGDRDEPPHVHIERDAQIAKFWLHPVRLQESGQFSRVELRKIERLVDENLKDLVRSWDSSSAIEIRPPRAQRVIVADDSLTVDLVDGRTVSVPLAWYPRLSHGTPSERDNWRLIGQGEGVHWPYLDEDISIEGLLGGRASGESQNSLKQWLADRDSAG